MHVRHFSVASVATLAIVMATGASNAFAAQSREVARATEMVPLIAVSRVTSPDRTFIERAANSAIKTMNTSQAEIDRSRVGDVQSEAVRAFNSAAFAYNKLADIASERRIAVATPSSIFEQEVTPSTVDGAPVQPADVEYLNMRPGSLAHTISIYEDEVKSGRDPAVVSFAKAMISRLEHDRAVAMLGVKSLDTNEYGDRPAEVQGSPTTL